MVATPEVFLSHKMKNLVYAGVEEKLKTGNIYRLVGIDTGVPLKTVNPCFLGNPIRCCFSKV